MLAFLLSSILAVLSIQAGEEAGFPAGFGLGKATLVESMMDAFWCSPIVYKDGAKVWVHKFHQAGKDAYFGFKCKLDDKSQEESTADLDIKLSRFALSGKGEVKVIEQNLPGLGLLSNAAFSGSLAAYWGLEKVGEGYLVSGVVYDLIKGKTLIKHPMGKDSPSTGNREYYARPIFDNTKKTVIFPASSGPSKIKGATVKIDEFINGQ